ncbi:DUF6879 family protein [Actinomadura rupiterrae]|uniref:DUF6879 family protein n=1 Tax=Actinomadura rupiterrae TaxID=559627 RepID=UPI0020A4B960|nr:DUF6879 family protein [Actinomadura rupiterrae]MCP2342952.1 hypothetical protein [Actinomadura rupiterrae]
MVDFVGGDPNSSQLECPAVWRDPETEGFFLQGKLVTDPAVLARLAQDVPRGIDEAVVWQPDRLGPALLEAAADTYDKGRTGHGKKDLETLIREARHSVVHLEQRDEYTAEPEYRRWLEAGKRADHGAMAAYMAPWKEFVGEVTAKGVVMRRARIVSEPLSDYIEWEHALTEFNVEAGEQVRWLSRRDAYDLLTPTADFYVIDSQLVAFNFNAGDGTSLREYEYVSDPVRVGPVVASFEQVWNRAVDHAEYKPTRTDLPSQDAT